MNARTKAMHKLVIEEAKALRKNATKEELNRLNFDSLNPASESRCVYGQMTKNCFSERATDLIIKCAKKVYVPVGAAPLSSNKLGGKPFKTSSREFKFYSPIEVFIYEEDYLNSGNNERLIQYLKGETKTLKFKE